ncbi:aerotaxis sensor receptor, flavoprotein [Salmonella enterica]|nr:aerotaxis sensor receptor, flavoprotein [Salmonella enterica]
MRLNDWPAVQSHRFIAAQLYERGELVDVLWGELEWSSPTDDDELPEVTGPAWIVDNVAHYGG